MPELTTEQLSKKNQERLSSLVAQGAQLNPFEFMNMRLEALIEFIFSNEFGAEGMTAEFSHALFDSQFAKQMESVIDDLESQFAKAKLTQGINEQASKDFYSGPQGLV